MSLLSRVRTKIAKKASYKEHRAELERWARIEYKKDWVVVYNYMLQNDGKTPTREELS